MDQQPTIQDSPIWLTVAQAAKRAQCGRRLIYREVQSGRLKAARIGGKKQLRFREGYVDAWLESSVTAVEVKG